MPPAPVAKPPLTEKELSVLKLLTRALTYEEVAARLGISINTVRTHVRVLYRKLGVRTRTAAVVKAMHAGLVR